MKRVVITGLGIISPLGNNISDFFDNLILGNTFVDYVSLFDASEFPTKIASEVKYESRRLHRKKRCKKNG